MRFYNKTEHRIILLTDKKSVVLESNKMIELDCKYGTKLTLKHTYDSTAMPQEKIAKDDMNESLVDMLLLSHKPPYFNIVLDCSYLLKCQPDEDIYIRREQIRPVYYCSYDRLYPYVLDGNVIEIEHTFKEKENFKKHYKGAMSKSTKKTLLILISVLTILMIPFALLAFLANIFAGIVVLLFYLGLLTIVCLFYILLSKLPTKIDYALIFSDFESSKIISCFVREKKGY